MLAITGCKNKSSIIHISRYALMFRNQADYLQIYSACFEVTKDYGKWQDLSRSHPEDGPKLPVFTSVAGSDWQHFENTALSDPSSTSGPPCMFLKFFLMINNVARSTSLINSWQKWYAVSKTPDVRLIWSGNMSVCPDVNEDEYLVQNIINYCIMLSKGPWPIHCDLATSRGWPLPVYIH